MNRSEFVRQLKQISPQTSRIVEDHLKDNDDELLLHLLVADFRRWAITTFYNLDGDGPVQSLLTVLGRALRDGDDEVVNAIAVSFVEDAGWWDQRINEFVRIWPPGLHALLENLRASSTQTLTPAVVDILRSIVEVGNGELSLRALERESTLTTAQLKRQVGWMVKQGLLIQSGDTGGRSWLRATTAGRAAFDQSRKA